MDYCWDDLAVFLALLRERTTSRAASALGISQPTVVRRLAALEQAIGLSLFDRSPSGLVPTSEALALRSLAEQVELAACRFRGEVQAMAGELDLIRLTFLDHFEALLIPILRGFHQRWPAVRAQLLASDRIYDLARGEVDIAIRGRQALEDDDVVVRELPPSGWTIYAAAHLPDDARPHTPAEVANRPLALVDGLPANLPIYAWLASLPSPHVMRCSHYRAILSAVASGAVVSALPCTVGDAEPDVVRCFPPRPEWDARIFLLGLRTILRQPPGRDLFDNIARHFADKPHLLMGRR